MSEDRGEVVEASAQALAKNAIYAALGAALVQKFGLDGIHLFNLEYVLAAALGGAYASAWFSKNYRRLTTLREHMLMLLFFAASMAVLNGLDLMRADEGVDVAHAALWRMGACMAGFMPLFSATVMQGMMQASALEEVEK